MRPVVGLVGAFEGDLQDVETRPFKEGESYDAILIAPGEEAPDGLPGWLPVVSDPKALRRAIRRWAVTIDDAQDIRGPGTVVFGSLAGGRLRMGETAVKEGLERSMRIREIRVDGRAVQEAQPGDRVALAFGPVPISLFRHDGVLRPGRPTKELVKAPLNTEVKEAILDAVGDSPDGRGTAAILKTMGKTPQQLGDAFEALRGEGRLFGFAGQWIKPKAFDEGVDRFIASLEGLHARQPSLPSHPAMKAVGAARLGWSGKPLDRILARLTEKGAIAMRDDEIRRPSFRVKLGDRQRALLDRIVEILEAGGTNPPNAFEVSKRLPAPMPAVNEILQLGEDVGEIATLSDGVLFASRGLAVMRERIRNGTQGRPFTLGEMRDSLGTSRRVAVALLERFDAEGFTERKGDARIVRG